MIMRKQLLIIFVILPALLKAEDGDDLWLRYKKIPSPTLLNQYKKQISSPVVLGTSQTISIIKAELSKAFSGLTGATYTISSSAANSSSFIAATASSSTLISAII